MKIVTSFAIACAVSSLAVAQPAWCQATTAVPASPPPGQTVIPPAVIAGLDGDWDGTLDVSTMRLRVVFHFKTDRNRELPMILGEMAVLPKHWWDGRDFAKPLTEPPLGSGPYRVGKFEFGRSVAYERVADWWARDRPTRRKARSCSRLRLPPLRSPRPPTPPSRPRPGLR